MTLVITELSQVGIVMAADSAITYPSSRKQEFWRKLLRVPKIRAAVSYWGWVGAVTRKQFDLWLDEYIRSEDYDDLSSFADGLATRLNRRCGNRPLPNGQEVGLHVAGYAQWVDGVNRPFFYHIHNGHGTMEVAPEFDPITGHVVAIHPRWAGEPRKLFEKHQDFPAQDKPLEENLAILERGGVRIRNGDYYIYKVVWDFLEVAFANLNLIPGVSVPSDPRNLRARKGFLKTAIEITKLIYQCSNQRQIIGGEVTSIAIGEQGILTG